MRNRSENMATFAYNSTGRHYGRLKHDTATVPSTLSFYGSTRVQVKLSFSPKVFRHRDGRLSVWLEAMHLSQLSKTTRTQLTDSLSLSVTLAKIGLQV